MANSEQAAAMCRYHVATRMPNATHWSYALGGGAGGGAPPRLPVSMVAGGSSMQQTISGNTSSYKCVSSLPSKASPRPPAHAPHRTPQPAGYHNF